MVEHIIKSLRPEDVGSVLLVLGLVREARLLVKIILDYKLAKSKK